VNEPTLCSLEDLGHLSPEGSATYHETESGGNQPKKPKKPKKPKNSKPGRGF
jgi:hypothetical protein